MGTRARPPAPPPRLGPARGARRLAIAAAVLVAAACSPRDGEGWAKGAMGEDGAEVVRGEASAALGIGSGLPLLRGGASPSAARLPRPYVVLATRDDPTRPASTTLVFHATNKRLATGVASASDVRGIVVLDADTVSVRGRKGGSSHTEYDVYVVDRATKAVTKTHAAKPDELETLLATLSGGP